MSLFAIICTNSAGWRGFAGKCRSRGIESNSDPRNLPSPGRYRAAARSDQSRWREVTPMGTAPANAREALDMVRAGLGYLAAADAARLPAAVQAECLRELEQHDAAATAARAGVLAAFAGGLGLADLAGLFAEMYVRARGDLPDQDRGREFADREVKLATTIGGAGVVHGDLTAECAAAVAAVLDALGAPAGAGDDRSKGQRYHDALAEAMRRLTAANLLPERAGQPVRAWAHISLADLV